MLDTARKVTNATWSMSAKLAKAARAAKVKVAKASQELALPKVVAKVSRKVEDLAEHSKAHLETKEKEKALLHRKEREKGFKEIATTVVNSGTEQLNAGDDRA